MSSVKKPAPKWAHALVLALVLSPCVAIGVAVTGDDVSPTRTASTTRQKAQTGFDALCSEDPTKFIGEAIGVAPDRVELVKCGGSDLTVSAFPRDVWTPATEHLSRLLPALVHGGHMRSGEMVFVHLRVKERGKTATGAPGVRTLSGAHYDFNTDSVRAKR